MGSETRESTTPRTQGIDWRWLGRRSVGRISNGFYRALLRDRNAHSGRCMIVAGTARSGTTWLGEIVASQVSCRVMFEPFQPDKVRAYRRFHYFQYLRPAQDDPAMSSFCDAVFTGRIRDAWIDRELATLRPEYRLVKEIRANLLLGWIARRYPEIPLLFVVRHPCAVVQSRLELGWATDTDIASFLRQPDLVEDFLRDRMDLIRSTRTDAGKHALIWCISNLVPLRQFGAGGLPTVFYEDLCTQPEIEIPRIFEILRQPYDETVFSSLALASSSARGRRAVVDPLERASSWRHRLSASQVAEVLAIVDAFGLGDLDGESARPLQRRQPAGATTIAEPRRET